MWTDLFSYSELQALATVIVIDLVLAGDNAIVVGMAAAGLPPDLRKRAIVFGIAAAAAMRIVFALFTTQLLNVFGLLLIGGLLLLWVCWKLWREIRTGGHAHEAAGADALDYKMDQKLGDVPVASEPSKIKPKTFRQALIQIIVADVSMSLDNVLAVAGTARHHLWVLVVGLTLSVALMGLAATMVAGLLKRFPWISYVGLVVIVYVALMMIWDGSREVLGYSTGHGAPPGIEAPAH
jgi:YjbE family integral membrane protein